MSEPIVDWIDGQPHSRLFGDIYFSRDGGLQESRYVFLQGNDLPARWRVQRPGDTFVIAETGFGTGLNFLCAWQAWNQSAAAGRLHFVSFEQHPLSRAQIRQAHAPWGELASLSSTLCSQYEAPHEGWHRFNFQGGAVALTLVIGDARTCLPRLSGNAHAWFLDGFAPARNPELWHPDLLKEVALHAHPGATFASYTSAGAVRRALQAAGFTVEKRRGYGRKREMTVGRLDTVTPSQPAIDRDALIIGAGVAGSATARALATRGWRVTVVDGGPHAAAGASGLPQATMHLRLPKRFLASHHLALHGYQHSLRLWEALSATGTRGWHATGTVQLAHASRRSLDAEGLERIGLPAGLATPLTQEEASDIAGLRVPSGGVHFPQGGWLEGPRICNALLDHPLIETRLGIGIGQLSATGEPAEWRLTCSDGSVQVRRTVILANAASAHALLPDLRLPLHKVRGQASLIAATPASRALRVVLCGEGVITPVAHGMHLVGATYRHTWLDEHPTDAEHEENRRMLASLCPAAYEALDLGNRSWQAAFVASRTTTPDRTPVAGPCPAPSCTGLYLNVAHGSRGFSTAPLLGEMIASQLAREPSPLPVELEAAVAPGRFRA